jgi:hypothetical protein
VVYFLSLWTSCWLELFLPDEFGKFSGAAGTRAEEKFRFDSLALGDQPAGVGFDHIDAQVKRHAALRIMAYSECPWDGGGGSIAQLAHHGRRLGEPQ